MITIPLFIIGAAALGALCVFWGKAIAEQKEASKRTDQWL